jgi:hypothetical protein
MHSMLCGLTKAGRSRMVRTYTGLLQYHTFEDRFRYLRLRSSVGRSTFGFDRYLNQRFYTSTEWRHVRNQVIARDNGCDLGIEDREIVDRIYIHHMNPMTVEDIEHGNEDILNPDFLISVSHLTHNAIHYGDENLLRKPLVERRPGDTKLW